MKTLKFYHCRHCGNVVMKFVDSGVRVSCCGMVMDEIFPAKKDEGMEKHLPVVEVKGDKVEVKVGSELHPMTNAHYVQFIAIETCSGMQVMWLTPEVEPKAEFMTKEPIKAVYAYCNIHGLWKTELK